MGDLGTWPGAARSEVGIQVGAQVWTASLRILRGDGSGGKEEQREILGGLGNSKGRRIQLGER